VVRVIVVSIGRDHQWRPMLAQALDHRADLLAIRGVDAGIGKLQIGPQRGAQSRGRGFGLALALLRRSPGAGYRG
jgi:hypothetical protein